MILLMMMIMKLKQELKKEDLPPTNILILMKVLLVGIASIAGNNHIFINHIFIIYNIFKLFFN